MAFWAENFGGGAIADPKRNFRFTVEFSNVDSSTGGPILWYAKSCTKPSFTVATAEHKYLNHTFYYPGSVTWDEITIELVDPVEPDIAATLSDIVKVSGYAPPNSVNDLGTMSKAGAASAMGNVVIQQLNGEGSMLEEWTLWNSFVTGVKYGELSYGDDELTTLSVTLRYDWAKLNTANASALDGGGGNEFFGSSGA